MLVDANDALLFLFDLALDASLLVDAYDALLFLFDSASDVSLLMMPTALCFFPLNQR